MGQQEDLLQIFESEVRAALNYLDYSHHKVQTLPLSPDSLEPESLETWESYSSRFARVTDIFLSKYLRAYVLHSDPAFRAELRDFVDKAEKMGLVSSADKWMEIRELRHKISHEYSRSDLQKTFKDVLAHTPFVLNELRRVFR